MTNKQIQIIEEILNEKIHGLICFTCVECQTHKLVYCNKCGTQFKQHKPFTLIHCIKIASQIQTKWREVMVNFRPSYIAAIRFRKYKNYVTEEEFTDYIEEKLRGI